MKIELDGVKDVSILKGWLDNAAKNEEPQLQIAKLKEDAETMKRRHASEVRRLKNVSKEWEIMCGEQGAVAKNQASEIEQLKNKIKDKSKPEIERLRNKIQQIGAESERDLEQLKAQLKNQIENVEAERDRARLDCQVLRAMVYAKTKVAAKALDECKVPGVKFGDQEKEAAARVQIDMDSFAWTLDHQCRIK